MDAATFLDTVRSANVTALDRLGSEKALIAVTAANLDRETVLASAAAAESRAALTFELWAADEGDPDAQAAFERVADAERDHLERLLGVDDVDAPDDPTPDALHAYLRDLEGTPERVGAGLVARPLVASRTLLQVISFFVNEGADDVADRFRDLRAETDEQAEDGAAVLEAVCSNDAAWDRAESAAGEAIQAAYGEYANALEEMGVDPKPVC